jgi:hypothetical protein
MNAFSCADENEIEDRQACPPLPRWCSYFATAMDCIFSMMAPANCEVLSFVAPSIIRSRSYVTRFWPMVRSIPVSISLPTSL